MAKVEAALMALAFLAVVVSAVTDIKTRKIKNWVTFPAIILGILVHLLVGGWGSGEGLGLKSSLIGLAIGSLPFLAMNTIDSRAFGMGDVKLMAAVGALVGWPLMLDVLIYVVIAGGLLAVVVLLRKKMLRRTLSAMLSRRDRSTKDGSTKDESSDSDILRSQYIPYGVAIAGGTVVVLVLEVARRGIF